MTRLQRFLILGSEGGSYYADERKLTLDNVKAVKRCITASEESGINAVTEIARISKLRRAAIVSFSSTSYNWGRTGRFASRIPHPARRGDDGRLTVVGSPIRGAKWNRQTIRRGR